MQGSASRIKSDGWLWNGKILMSFECSHSLTAFDPVQPLGHPKWKRAISTHGIKLYHLFPQFCSSISHSVGGLKHVPDRDHIASSTELAWSYAPLMWSTPSVTSSLPLQFPPFPPHWFHYRSICTWAMGFMSSIFHWSCGSDHWSSFSAA